MTSGGRGYKPSTRHGGTFGRVAHPHPNRAFQCAAPLGEQGAVLDRSVLFSCMAQPDVVERSSRCGRPVLGNRGTGGIKRHSIRSESGIFDRQRKNEPVGEGPSRERTSRRPVVFDPCWSGPQMSCQKQGSTGSGYTKDLGDLTHLHGTNGNTA